MRAVVNGVYISFALGVIAGMKGILRLFGMNDPYIPREHGIEYKGQLFWGDASRIVKMGALTQSMHARVGAPGALYDYSAARQSFKRSFQLSLYAGRVFLKLPASVIGSVI